MSATIIDSRIFGNIFSTEAMRRVWSDENRTAKYLAIERALARRAGPARHHSEGGGRRDRPQLRHRQDRHGQAAGADGAHRLSHPRRRLAAQRAMQGQARRVLPLGRHDAGHHRHRYGAADPRCACDRRGRARGDFRCTGEPVPQLSRHADRRQEQPAAGDTGDLRLQDGDHPRRGRAAPRAARRSCGPACSSENSAAPAARWRRSSAAPWKRRPASWRSSDWASR